MSQKHTISGRRPALIWLSILMVLILLVAVLIIVLFIYPNYQRQQQVEQHYQAGVAFQDVGDWDKAVEAFENVVAIDATYKDARTRLAEVKSKQQEALAQAQAKAAQATATAQARAEATATAATVEARIAQATSVAATAIAQAKATAQAKEAKATATAEALAQLEEHYQKGLGYMNMGRWEEAKAELEQVFEVDPNYRDVQIKLVELEAKIAELTPTPVPVPTNVALGKPVMLSTNRADDPASGQGEWPEDITDGSLEYITASHHQEDGCIGFVNQHYDQLMVITISIDLEERYRITRIRYNQGNVGYADTWNADVMESPFGTIVTKSGKMYMGAWTEQTGDLVASNVTIGFKKTRTSTRTDWLFIGEIEVYGVPVR